MTDDRALVKLAAARLEIEAARSVGGLKNLHDKMATLEAWLARAGGTLETCNEVAELRLRAERKIGDILASEKRGRGRPKKSDTVSNFNEICEERGVSRRHAARWVKESEVPSADFEGWVDECKAQRQEISSAALISFARKLAAEERREGAGEAAELEGTYSIILADPPWAFGASTVSGSADTHYPTMPTPEIVAMPIRKHAADVAALFLWIPNSHLPEGLLVMKSWGFSYKTNLVWVKDKPTTGMSYHTRGQHELLLYGTRGNLMPDRTMRPISVVQAEVAEHSRKPEEFHILVEKMYPGQIYLELFARRERPGWTCWGNEVSSEVSE